MLAGYLAGRTRLMSDTNSEVLNRFVLNVSFPALVFISLSKVNVEEFFNWPFLGALGGGMLATFAISFLVARVFFPGSLTALGLHGLTAMFSSTAYIGLPLILVAFGNDALVPGIIGAVITGVLFLPIAIVLAEIDKGRSTGNLVLAPALSVMRNPVLIATVAGLAASALGIAIPKPVNVFCDLLGGAFVPCALFSAGLFMVGCTVKGEATEITWLVFAKLALHPLITWWLAYHVFELDGILPAVAVLQAALPTGVPVFILAQQYDVFVARSNATIVISTALSVATLSALLIVLG
jgi:predicted permease